MTDLDELERLAKAALAQNDEPELEHWYESYILCSKICLMNVIDSIFIEKCTPKTVLQLIAANRKLTRENAAHIIERGEMEAEIAALRMLTKVTGNSIDLINNQERQIHELQQEIADLKLRINRR